MSDKPGISPKKKEKDIKTILLGVAGAVVLVIMIYTTIKPSNKSITTTTERRVIEIGFEDSSLLEDDQNRYFSERQGEVQSLRAELASNRTMTEQQIRDLSNATRNTTTTVRVNYTPRTTTTSVRVQIYEIH